MSEHLKVEAPNYTNVNRLIAQTASSLLSSFRYNGVSTQNMQTLQTNLIPYQRIHFISPAFSALIPENNSYYYSPSVHEITKEVFSSRNTMVKANPAHGKYMSCALMYRGDCTLKDVMGATQDIRKDSTINFAEWAPTGMKITANGKLPTVIPNTEMAKA